jgi:hypothetical protein
MMSMDTLWNRHKNIWSWVMRPIFGLVMFYGAWLNSWEVLLLGLFGLSTSWFWFPKPKKVNQLVEQFIDIERTFLTPPWTKTKISSLLFVVVFVLFSLFCFWSRSLTAALMLMFFGGLAKSLWSINVAGKSGYIAAAFGAFWAVAALMIYMSTRT